MTEGKKLMRMEAVEMSEATLSDILNQALTRGLKMESSNRNSEIRIETRARYFAYIDGCEHCVVGTDESFDWIHDKLIKIERIKFLRCLNKGLGLKQAKDVMEHHVRFVPLAPAFAA